MQIFNSGFYWFVQGILFVFIIMGFRAWMEGRGVPMPAWKWIVFVGWLLFCGFTIAFVGTSLGENEATAAMRGGALFGSVAVISGFGVYRLLMMGAGSGEKPTAPA